MNDPGPDGGWIPLPAPDGRFVSEFRFRIDAGAPQSDVATLHALLRLRPAGTTILFGVERERGVRALRIEGRELGEVYAFSARIVAAIRRIGDLVPRLAAAPAETAATDAVPDEQRTAAEPAQEPARWSYEPPGTFLEESPPPAPTVAARLRSLGRIFSRRDG